MKTLWLWARTVIIIVLAVFVYCQRTAGGYFSTYEARALTVMGQVNTEGKEILQELACGRGAGIYHLVAEGDIVPGGGPEKVIGVSISKDRGVLGVFDTSGEHPVLMAYLNTLPLQEVKIIQLENGRNAVLIRELLDERVGAYFFTSFYALYNWHRDDLQEIWRKVISNEQQWNRRWFEQGDGWKGVSEQVETGFSRENGRLAIKSICSQTLWSAPSVDGLRTTIRSRTLTHTYRWEPEWNAMVMAEGRLNKEAGIKVRQGNKYVESFKLKAGEKVAITEDENLLSWIDSKEPSYWRVKTKSGETGFVTKNCIDIVKRSH